MNTKELEAYLWGAANILRGLIDAADFKQYIFPLLFFKRISDVWDEEYQQALEESGDDFDYAEFKENHRFQIPKGCHWEDVRKKTTNVGAALQKALREIEKANEKLHDVFGDAQWTNKRRMSDEKMLDLIEHFSKYKLSVAEVPHDIMGEGYEYLIKKFADDSGHTAAEFYTNRTVVKLMTMITDPQSGESVYDPTCGSGGILLNSALHLKEQGKEYRTLKLYGQELNLITSAIARINMFMHNVDEFLIVQGDTLGNPQILENDELKKFDVIMANPPYSVKRWNQPKWSNDPFGRNIWGTPPQGNADYAFQQHIMASLKPNSGRSVTLFPHGVLFRDAESDIRKKMIEGDYVDAVIGLGSNLFYNSSMESCLLVCRMKKPKERKGKIIFINAVNELRIERSTVWLEPQHLNKISDTYWNFKNVEGFAKVVSNKDVLENSGNLSLQLYVKQSHGDSEHNVNTLIADIREGQDNLSNTINSLFKKLAALGFNTQNNNLGSLIDNLVSEKPAFGNLLDGKKLRKVKYGEVVNKLTRRIDPANSGIERFVAGEHLQSEDFKIKEWGTVDTEFLGPAFNILFKPGDILYGSRRTYLKKVALADFEGICANTTYVIRADENILSQDLLKYIMLSERFTRYSIGVSKGSTNPYINWKDLNDFIFEIPDLETQREIVSVLDEIMALAEQARIQAQIQDQTLKTLKQKFLNEILD